MFSCESFGAVSLGVHHFCRSWSPKSEVATQKLQLPDTTVATAGTSPRAVAVTVTHFCNFSVEKWPPSVHAHRSNVQLRTHRMVRHELTGNLL